MSKISVIMPSFNVAAYIGQCLKSVQEQTLCDLEIIVVDAGSTDGTLEIVQSCAKEDARIKILQSERRSYGYQMNLGLMQAHGDYIGIVETDDIIAEDAYMRLYQRASEDDCDYVKGAAVAFYALGNGRMAEYEVARNQAGEERINMQICPAKMPELLMKDIFIWNGIYRRDFLQDMRFHETSGAAFQDQGFLLQTISAAQKAAYISEIVYYYRQDNGTASTRNKNGFKYLVQEYGLNAAMVNAKSMKWRMMFYYRLFRQCIGRFREMTYGGEYWSEAQKDIEVICQWLGEAVKKGCIDDRQLEIQDQEDLQMLLNGPVKLFDKYNDMYQSKKREWETFIHDFSGKDIVIFGCGNWGRFLHMVLLKRNHENIVALCDNDSKLWWAEMSGTTILPLQIIRKHYPEAHFVIANKAHYAQIQRQLLKEGVSGDRISRYTMGCDIELLRMN